MPAEIGTEAGESFALFGGRVVGRNVELVPGRKIVQVWRATYWPEDAGTIVRIEFHSDGDHTRLVLDHDGVPEDRVTHVDAHWRTRYWQALRFYLEPHPPASEGRGRRRSAAAPPPATLPGTLRALYPWPDIPATARPYLIDIDGGGRFLVDRLLATFERPTLLEIGSFLGGSTLRWLQKSPTVEVVALDPWSDRRAGDFVSSEEWWFTWPKPSADVVRTLNARDGLYQTFLANLAPFKDRIVPVRGRSELLLEPLAATGLEPDLVYIDADKKRSDSRRLLSTVAAGAADGRRLHVERRGRLPDAAARQRVRRRAWVLGLARVPDVGAGAFRRYCLTKTPEDHGVAQSACRPRSRPRRAARGRRAHPRTVAARSRAAGRTRLWSAHPTRCPLARRRSPGTCARRDRRCAGRTDDCSDACPL